MVNEFFVRLAKEGWVADECAKSITHSRNGTLKFSKMFSVLFPSDGNLNSNVKTWLHVISEHFFFDKLQCSSSIVYEVEKMFNRFKMNPNVKENVNTFNFMVYLVWMYTKLDEQGYKRDDNILNFMRGCAFDSIKIVMVGNDPAKDVESSGFAFHESVCPSSKKILAFLNCEMKKLCENTGAHWPLKLYWKVFVEAKHNCNLFGWISQGVLMINSKLTLDIEGMEGSWEILTDFLIKMLGKQRNLVFMFLGRAVADKKGLVSEHKHLVMELYHPSTYTYASNNTSNEGFDWKPNLPFINANFYLHQVNKTPIDWTSIGWMRGYYEKRMREWDMLFDRLLGEAGYKQNAFVFQHSYLVTQHPKNGTWRLNYTN